MNEKLLCKCPNSILAHNISSLLKNENITFRQHDETNDPRAGAYGPTPGIAIYVLEEDYEKAFTLIEPIINAPTDNIRPFCPKCGSEDTESIERSKLAKPLLILSTILFIAPCVYLYCTMVLGNKSTTIDYLAIVSFIASLVIFGICNKKSANQKCNQCGKKFIRR